jgi:hypothetical protein
MLLTMRAVLRRPGAAKDSYGGPAQAAVTQWPVIAPVLHCRAYSSHAHQYVDGKVVAVEQLVLMAAASADLKPGDCVDGVKDRRGRDVLAGHLFVNTVIPVMRGATVSHLEASLKRTR